MDFDVSCQFVLTNTPILGEGIRRTGDENESALSFNLSSTVSNPGEAQDMEEECLKKK